MWEFFYMTYNRTLGLGGQPGRLLGWTGCSDYLAFQWIMVVTEDLGILKWWTISLCDWPAFFNSKIAEIVSDEYSRLEPLGLEGIINFEVLMMEKFEFENFAIFCVPLGTRFRSMTSYTRLYMYMYVLQSFRRISDVHDYMWIFDLKLSTSGRFGSLPPSKLHICRVHWPGAPYLFRPILRRRQGRKEFIIAFKAKSTGLYNTSTSSLFFPLCLNPKKANYHHWTTSTSEWDFFPPTFSFPAVLTQMHSFFFVFSLFLFIIFHFVTSHTSSNIDTQVDTTSFQYLMYNNHRPPTIFLNKQHQNQKQDQYLLSMPEQARKSSSRTKTTHVLIPIRITRTAKLELDKGHHHQTTVLLH